MEPLFTYLIAGLSVIIIGIAKAGFGGGVGIIAVPMLMLVIPSHEALGVMLPILCLCDWFALYHYRSNFHRQNVFWLIPGVIVGIIAASFFLGTIDEATLKYWIGIICLLFVAYQIGKGWILKELGDYQPVYWHGWCFGFGVGVTSTLAHAAGPVATMYLLPQNMGKRLFVGTTVTLFTMVNILKLPSYFYLGMIDLSRLQMSLILMPLVPLGVYLGIWMNKHISETWFNRVIYIILVLMGLNMVWGIDPVGWLLESLK